MHPAQQRLLPQSLPQQSSAARGRLHGGPLAAVLFIDAPSLLLFSIAYAADSRMALIAGASWAAATALVRGLLTLLNAELFSFCRLTAAFCLTFLLGGTVPFNIECLIYGDSPSAAALGMFPVVNVMPQAYVALYLVVFHAVCEFVGEYDNRWWLRAIDRLRSQTAATRRFITVDLMLLAGLGALSGYAVLSGKIGINKMYFDAGDGGANSVVGSLLTVLPPLAIGIAAALCYRHRRNIVNVAIVVILALPCLVVLFSLGRRPLIFSLTGAATLLMWQYGRRFRVSTILITLVVAAPLLNVLSTTFQAVRLSYHELGGRGAERSLLESLNETANLEASYTAATERSLSDFTARANSVNFFVEFADRMQPDQHTMGWLSLAAILRNIPSAIWKEKLEMTKDVENSDYYVMRLVGMFETDATMPVPALAYVEFGWFGVLGAAAMLLLLSWAMSALAIMSSYVAVPAAALSTAIFTGLNVETDFAIAINAVRNLAMVVIPMAMVGVALRNRSGRRSAVR